MKWRVLIGFQAVTAALMVLVCGSLLLEARKDSSLKPFLLRWVMILPSSSGTIIGAMEFF